MCVGAMIHARIGRLVYGATDLRFGVLGGAFNVLAEKQFNHKFEITSNILDEKCGALLKDFFSTRRQSSTH